MVAILAEKFSFTPTDMEFAKELSERISALEYARDPITLDGLTGRVDDLFSQVDSLSLSRADVEDLRLSDSQLSSEISAIQVELRNIKGLMTTSSPVVANEQTKALRKELMELQNQRAELIRAEAPIRKRRDDELDAYNRDNLRGRQLLMIWSKALDDHLKRIEAVNTRIIEIQLQLDD